VTFAPKTLLDARTWIIANMKVPAASVGIVGDAKHFGGYHCGKNRILGNDYSVVQSSRDRNGLSMAASAIDIGMFTVKRNGKTVDLKHFSNWLVNECAKGAKDTLDIREVIYSPDGKTVKRWDRLKKSNTGDSSHLWHTHISYFRDSENRDKVSLFKRYLEGDTVSAKEVWNTDNVLDTAAMGYSAEYVKSNPGWAAATGLQIAVRDGRVVRSLVEQLTAQVAALTAAVGELAKGGGVDPDLVRRAAEDGAKTALANLTISWDTE
jgi:hypothetical protein